MRWFQITETLILPFHYESNAYQYALTHQLPISAVKPLRLKRCTIGQFLALIDQILYYTQQGHSLQSALLKQQTHRLSINAQRAMRIIACQLAQGVAIRQALALVVPPKAAALVALIPDNSTEESKIAALEITRQSMQQQMSLSQQLLKSLTYPYTVVQSAFILVLVNALLTKGSITWLALIWCLLTILQIYLYRWIKAGSAYALIAHYCKSFRTHGLLDAKRVVLRVASAKSGRPMHCPMTDIKCQTIMH